MANCEPFIHNWYIRLVLKFKWTARVASVRHSLSQFTSLKAVSKNFSCTREQSRRIWAGIYSSERFLALLCLLSRNVRFDFVGQDQDVDLFAHVPVVYVAAVARIADIVDAKALHIG